MKPAFGFCWVWTLDHFPFKGPGTPLLVDLKGSQGIERPSSLLAAPAAGRRKAPEELLKPLGRNRGASKAKSENAETGTSSPFGFL